MNAKFSKKITVLGICLSLMAQPITLYADTTTPTPDTYAVAEGTDVDTDGMVLETEKNDETVNGVTNIYQTFKYELPLSWSAVAGIRCVNNELEIQDYRMDSGTFSKIADRFNISVNGESAAAIENLFYENDRRTYTETEIITGEDGKEVAGDIATISPEYAWLIRNNIISNVESLKLFSTEDEYQKPKTNLSEQFRKSDFLMALYKTKWGVIPSRLVYRIDKPQRNGVDVSKIEGYSIGSYAVNAEFIGDWEVYAFPNVYELYLADLLNMGIIDIGDISSGSYGKKFLEGYTQILYGYDSLGQLDSDGNKLYPAWSTYLDPMQYTGGKGTGFIANSLGYSWNSAGNKISDKESPIKYFKKENISVMDALKIAQKFMLYSEENLTDMESKIITYKYGVSYLSQVLEEDQSTLSFAIAKGILNFEDETEFSDLYGKMSTSFAHKLLYRIANEEARFDFSSVTLTDGESYWSEKGFQETDISVINSEVNVNAINWNKVKVKDTEDNKEEDVAISGTIIGKVENATRLTLLSAGPREGELNLFSLDKTNYVVTTPPVSIAPTKSPTATTVVTPTPVLDEIDKDTKSYAVEVSGVAGYYNYTYGGTSFKFLELLGSNCDKDATMSRATGSFGAPSFKNAEQTKITAFGDALMKMDEEISLINYNANENTCDFTFLIKAETAQKAFETVYSRLKIGALNSDAKVTGVTNILSVKTGSGQTKDTSSVTTMISASSLKNVASSLNASITVVRNNILKNNDTGVTAILLPEQGIALVGNSVIHLKDAMVIASTNEVYYNLEVICHLISNALLLKVPGMKYQIITKTSDAVIKELKNKVGIYQSATSGLVLDTTYFYTNKFIFDTTADVISDSGNPAYFFRLSDITNSFNTIQSTINTSDGEYKLIVDFEYQIPEDAYDSSYNDIKNISNPTELYNTPPITSRYTKFWNTNLALSNALANYIYGTNDITYFTSGWLVPSLTILSYDIDTELTVMKDLFVDNVNFTKLLKQFGYRSSGMDWQKEFNSSSSPEKKRRLNVYYNIKTSGNYCTIFGTDENTGSSINNAPYFTNAVGVVYKNLKNESRTLFVLKDSGAPTRGYINSKTVSYNDPDVGSEIDILLADNTTQKFYYAGVTKNGGKKYYVIQPVQNDVDPKVYKDLKKNSISSKEITAGELKPLMSTKLPNVDYLSNIFADRWYKALSSTASRPSWVKNKDQYTLAGSDSWDYTVTKNKIANTLLITAGTYLKISDSKTMLVYNSANTTSIKTVPNKMSSGIAYTPVVLYLPVNNYSWELTDTYYNQTYKLVDSKYVATVSKDFYKISLNEKIISLLYADSLGSTEVNKLNQNDQLVIKGITFTKQQDGTFVSNPIEAPKNMKQSNYAKAGYFGSLFKPLLGEPIRVGSLCEDLSEYVISYKVDNSTQYWNPLKLFLYSDVKDGKLLIGKIGENRKLTTTKAYKAKAGFNYYCIKVEFSDSLKCRPINSESTLYNLLNVANDFADGQINYSPFEHEEIAMTELDDIIVESTNFAFYDVENKDELVNEFEEELLEVKTTDAKTIVLVILLILAILAVVMMWLSYFVVAKGMGRSFFEGVSDVFVRKDGSRGFDPVKLMSFTVFNLDEEPRAFNLIIATVLFIVFITVLAVVGLGK